MSDDAQAIDLKAPRTCPYCGIRPCMPGVMNCMPCMQNILVRQQHRDMVNGAKMQTVKRPSWLTRLWRWFLDP